MLPALHTILFCSVYVRYPAQYLMLLVCASLGFASAALSARQLAVLCVWLGFLAACFGISFCVRTKSASTVIVVANFALALGCIGLVLVGTRRRRQAEDDRARTYRTMAAFAMAAEDARILVRRADESVLAFNDEAKSLFGDALALGVKMNTLIPPMSRGVQGRHAQQSPAVILLGSAGYVRWSVRFVRFEGMSVALFRFERELASPLHGNDVSAFDSMLNFSSVPSGGRTPAPEFALHGLPAVAAKAPPRPTAQLGLGAPHSFLAGVGNMQGNGGDGAGAGNGGGSGGGGGGGGGGGLAASGQLSLSSTGVNAISSNGNGFGPAEWEAYHRNFARKLRMVASIAHEYRTPLQTIQMAVELMQRSRSVLAGENELFLLMSEAAEDMLELVVELEEFVQVDLRDFRIQEVVFDLRRLLFRCARLKLAEAHKKHVDIVLNISTTFPRRVIGDSKWIRHIVLKFLSSAIKATPQDSAIEVDVLIHEECITEDDSPAIVTHIVVKDLSSSSTPAGSPANKLGPWPGSLANVDGTGESVMAKSDMVVCAQLASLMNGQVSYRMREVRGAESSLALPLKLPQNTDLTEKAFFIRLPAGARPPTVMLVCRHEVLLKSLFGTLRSWGFNVVRQAAGMAGAVSALRGSSSPVNVLLIENSCATAQDIADYRALAVQPPIVLIIDSQVEPLLNFGEVGQVAKPISEKLLFRLLLDLLHLDRAMPSRGKEKRSKEESGQLAPASAGADSSVVSGRSSGSGPPVGLTSPAEYLRDSDRRKGISIAIVDDDNMMMAVLSRWFMSMGYAQPSTFTAGSDFLRACETRRFDLVLCDVVMPNDLSGVATIARLRRLERETDAPPAFVYVLTGQGEREVGPELSGMQVSAVLHKPFKQRMLHDQLEKFHLCRVDPSVRTTIDDVPQALADSSLAAVSSSSSSDHGGGATSLTKMRTRLLYADDEPIARTQFAKMMEKAGFLVDTAQNGLVASAMWSANPAMYGAVLTDCEMPLCDGYELTRRIRAFEKQHALIHTLVVAVTGRSNAELCTRAGMDEFVRLALRLPCAKSACTHLHGSYVHLCFCLLLFCVQIEKPLVADKVVSLLERLNVHAFSNNAINGTEYLSL